LLDCAPQLLNREKIMNTLQSINTRNLLLVSVFAAMSAYVQASQAADSFGDAQSQVRAVLEGARSPMDSSRPATTDAASQTGDIQARARQILMGTVDANVRRTGGGTSVTASAGLSVDMQKRTQRVVLGRAAS
jgi:hypothetical protein